MKYLRWLAGLVGIFAGLTIVVVSVESYRFRSAFDSLVPSSDAPMPRDLADLETVVFPPSANAATQYLEASQEVDWSTHVGHAWQLPEREWSEAMRQEIVALLAAHRGPLDRFERASHLEQTSFEIRYRDGLGAPIPDLLGILRAGKLLVFDAQLELSNDSVAAAVPTVRVLSHVADALSRERLLIFSLCGLASDRMALRLAAEILEHDGLVASQLEELRQAIPSHDQLERARQAVIDDAAITGTSLRFGYRNQGKGSLRPAWPIRLVLGPTLGREMLDTGLLVAATASTPYRLWSRQSTDYTTPWISLYSAFASAAGRLEYAGTRDGVSLETFRSDLRSASMLGANLADTIAKFQSVAAQQLLVETAIEVRLHALESGRYPDDRRLFPGFQQPDPYTGRTIEYDSSPRGPAVLRLAGALELEKERYDLDDAKGLEQRFRSGYDDLGPFAIVLPAASSR